MAEDMVILTRTFDLLEWLIPKAERFPKTYRRTVTHHLLEAALEFQEMIFAAQSERGEARLAHLRAADARLNTVRLYLRLAHHWHWLNDGQYRHVSALVAEVGRLLGGWLKQAKVPPHLPPLQGG